MTGLIKESQCWHIFILIIICFKPDLQFSACLKTTEIIMKLLATFVFRSIIVT